MDADARDGLDRENRLSGPSSGVRSGTTHISDPSSTTGRCDAFSYAGERGAAEGVRLLAVSRVKELRSSLPVTSLLSLSAVADPGQGPEHALLASAHARGSSELTSRSGVEQALASAPHLESSFPRLPPRPCQHGYHSRPHQHRRELLALTCSIRHRADSLSSTPSSSLRTHALRAHATVAHLHLASSHPLQEGLDPPLSNLCTRRPTRLPTTAATRISASSSSLLAAESWSATTSALLAVNPTTRCLAILRARSMAPLRPFTSRPLCPHLLAPTRPTGNARTTAPTAKGGLLQLLATGTPVPEARPTTRSRWTRATGPSETIVARLHLRLCAHLRSKRGFSRTRRCVAHSLLVPLRSIRTSASSAPTGTFRLM